MKPLPLLLLLVACSPKVVQPTVRDSVRIEYRERVVRDTVTFEVPRIVEKITTPDTASHLKNEWAKSDAWTSAGELHHTLSTTPHIVKVPVLHTVRDTVMVEKKAETVIKEVNILTRWQSFLMSLGKVFIGCVVAFIIFIGIKLFKKIKI